MSKIFILFLISYLIYRWLIRPFVKPRHKGFYSTHNSTSDQTKKEGDVNMSGKPESSKKVFDKSDGDYVDYEEVD